jgi:hypothetical protein
MGDGGIKKAAGEITGDIPVFTGLDLTKLGFGLEFSPTRIEGLIGVDLAKVLGVEGTFTDTVDPGDFQVGGTLTIKGLGLEVGEAHVDWSTVTNNLTLAAKIGKDFGPVSLEAEVDGGVHFPDNQYPDFEWYVEGQGHACEGACFNVTALAGSKAIAACGEFRLLFTTLSAGFAYVWGQGVNLFSGCDMSSYIPPAFPKGEQPSSAGDPAPLHPGQSEQFTLCPSPPGQPPCTPTSVGRSRARGCRSPSCRRPMPAPSTRSRRSSPMRTASRGRS